MIKRILGRITHTIYELPVLVLMPHSRCNCRCVMCDIWKANHNKQEISDETLNRHLGALKKLQVKHVALSGGEALMHSNLWKLCEGLKSIDTKISLLSTGITLKAHAQQVVRHVDEVIVSLDGSPALHNKIRNLPSAYEKLAEGVKALKDIDPAFRVTGRCVLQKLNYNHFVDIVTTAKALDLDQISFLAADISSSAFNHTEPRTSDDQVSVMLDMEDVRIFEKIIKASFHQFPELYHARYIAESPKKMMDIVTYYKAMLDTHDFPQKRCNAPWVSAVIESDGEVRPCFFFPSYGNIYQQDFNEIINSREAVAFRKNLDMKHNPTCKRCVCSLYVGVLR
jgi:MoaA/NifB/PqqE/SkfB family radical SAM enzyme